MSKDNFDKDMDDKDMDMKDTHMDDNDMPEKAPEENYTEDSPQDVEMKEQEQYQQQKPESAWSMDGVTILGRRIGLGYIAMAILIVVILFFGAKSKIMDYFSEPHKLEAAEINTPPMNPQPAGTTNSQPADSTSAMVKDGAMPSQSATNMQAASNSMTDDQVKDIVKNYILNNPEIIMESLTKLQKKAEEQQVQASKEYISKSGDTISQGRPFIGNKAGTMNIVEFFDYQCVHCKLVYPDLMKLIQAYPDLKISLVQLPFMGQDSANAVKFSMAVNNLYPDKFYDFHSDLLKADQLNEQVIFSLIQKYAMNKDDLIKESNSDAVTKAITANLELAQKSGVRGVPSFIINGEFVPGAPSYDDLKMKIDAMRGAK